MNQHIEPLLFAGTSDPKLAERVAELSGIRQGSISIERFPDGEIAVEVLESVRGRDVFVMQTIAIHPNEFLMELLILIDTMKRASARSINVVIPYFGYARQDRRDKGRVPITAKLVANLLTNAGANQIVTMDLHAAQIQGFFDIHVDNLYGRPNLVKAVLEYGINDLVVVTPDVGSVKLVRDFATQLNVNFAIVDKHRTNAHDVTATTVIGDVYGKDVLLADDMCSTAGTLVSAAKACREKGAKNVFAAVTHGLFVGEAIERISNAHIDKIFYCNTVPTNEQIHSNSKFQEVCIANLLADAMRCILSASSISFLTAVNPPSGTVSTHC
jgi:ribose-phosphate pyrophosphokinase